MSSLTTTESMTQHHFSRAERVEQVQALRKRGFSVNEIAIKLGLARSTAAGYFNDPDGSKDKARKQRYCGTCGDCGGPTTGSNGYDAAPTRCRWCANGVPMNDRRRPHQPSLRRCIPIVLAEIPLEVRMQAALDANKHERDHVQREQNMAAALWPDKTEVFWVAEGGLEVLAEYVAAVTARLAA